MVLEIQIQCKTQANPYQSMQ